MQFIETSAKMNTNVNEAFETLGKLMIEFNSQQKQAMTQDKKDKKVLGASSGKNLNTKKGCC